MLFRAVSQSRYLLSQKIVDKLGIADKAVQQEVCNIIANRYFELNDIYEDIRGIAGEYDIPIWTASQANRSSTEEDVIEGNKVSESYNKVMVCDFIMSLSRKLNDKIGGTGRWHIIKNRFGPDGMTFPSKINTTNGHIDIFEPNSDMGKSVSENMKGDTMVKKALAQKFKELEGF